MKRKLFSHKEQMDKETNCFSFRRLFGGQVTLKKQKKKRRKEENDSVRLKSEETNILKSQNLHLKINFPHFRNRSRNSSIKGTVEQT